MDPSLLTRLADGGRVGLALLLELGPAVRALHNRKRASAFLKLNLNVQWIANISTSRL